MDKERRLRDQTSPKNVASTHQRAKWASGSKFNRILSNLERSILNQFNNNSSNSGSSRGTTSKSISGNSSSNKSSNSALIKQTTARQKLNPSLTPHANANTIATSAAAVAQQVQQNKRCNEQQVPKDHHHTTSSHQVITATTNSTTTTSTTRDKIKLQLKSAGETATTNSGNNGKMTLNKYQQQIVSTMRPNQLIINNKLSIPPPHANDEARNQSHRLLFGGVAASQLTDHRRQSSDLSAACKPSPPSLKSPPNRLTMGDITKQLDKTNDSSSNKKIDAHRQPNLSPASSAKSLPTLTSTTKQLPGSQYPSNKNNNNINTINNNNNEDEESGFSTYQSRRSLFANATNNSNSTTTGEPSKESNNMILMQTSQVPIGSINFNLNNSTSTQQFVYNYQHPQMKQHTPQSMTTTQQQQFVASNQVPIISIDPTSNNCYTNNSTNNQLHTVATAQQRLNGSNIQFSDHHPHPQLYGLYGMPIASAMDNGQQIYANAPPKPRRYQYYDSANHHRTIFPQIINTPIAVSSSALAMTTDSMSSSNGNAPFIHHLQPPVAPFNRHQQNFPQMSQQQQQQQHQTIKQQLLQNQPIYNISYLQIPGLYQQGEQMNNYQLNNCDYIQQQQRPPANLRNTLTKSKSSLEACDLVRFKLDKPLISNNTQSNTLRFQPHHQQQLIYGQRFDNGLNRYPTLLQNQQMCPTIPVQQFAAQTNLQRSKSVTQLLPEYQRHEVDQQVRELLVDGRQQQATSTTTIGPKFLSVSSASTTNLNFVGLANNRNQQIMMPQRNQFAKIPSQLNISHHQQQSLQYHDSVQQKGDQLYSATAQLQRQHPSQRINNNWLNHHQASPNYHSDFNTNQLQQQHRATNLNRANPALSNNGKTFVVRQSQGDNFAPEDGFIASKPSLDDKIRHLLIGKDSETTTTTSDANLVLDGSKSKQNDNNDVIYHQSNNNANNLSKAWPAKQLSIPSITNTATKATTSADDLLVSNGGNLVLKRESSGQNASTSLPFNNSPRIGNITTSSQNYLYEPDQLTNRIYINESHSKMGNRHQRQYQVEVGENRRKNADTTSSHLIVDLTTPRVLAKTQTTLLPTGTNNQEVDEQQQERDSWSINQVGLPQLSAHQATTVTNVLGKAQRSPNFVDNSNSSQPQTTTTLNFDIYNDKNESTNNKLVFSATNTRDFNNIKPVCERTNTTTAPYYYSDLKSEEQRQALLSIVQQKSLSPPPQLLSRSTDQSSTRLAPKSATLHSGHARALSESLSQRQQRQTRAVSKGDIKYSPSNDFSSTSNIAKNIDKLFDSPVNQQTDHQRIKAVQSMLALNDCKADNTDSSHLSSFQTTSESISSGYCSGDLRNQRNFSKSKSLENISQRSFDGGLDRVVRNSSVLDKFGNPVYENIRRSDKLMSAINNSTTCLSTSTSRSGHRRVAANNTSTDYSRENGNVNGSDESMDSILGSSSLDESDSSLDIIDEIKISPTDNHLTDISQLIEQLKSNHSKLSEEYKSTLMRISKTINTKNRQMSDSDQKSKKLARRLQLLELKSKKCESRSKNQLALIQMMEKVLHQSKLRASNTGQPTTGSPPQGPLQQQQQQHRQQSATSGSTAGISLADNPVSSSSIETARPSTNSSPCLSFDYQNVKQSNLLAYSGHHHVGQSKDTSHGSNSLITNNINSSINGTQTSNEQASKVTTNIAATPNSNAMHPRPATQNVIKAIVTEAKSSAKFVSDVKKRPAEEVMANKSTSGQRVSLSTRHQQNLQNAATSLSSSMPAVALHPNKASSAVGKQMFNNNETRSNPFTGGSGDGDDSTSSSSSSVDNEACGLLSKISKSPSSGGGQNTNESGQVLDRGHNYSQNNGLHLMRDDEDFIEFMSSDGSSHRSQFEASQFSASDFNTSASTSESSTLGAANDSLNSPTIMSGSSANKHLFTNGAMNTTGILKSAKNGGKAGLLNNNNNNTIETNNNNGSSSSSNSRQQSGHNEGEEKGKFNNVLGNVIDVDICPMNNLSQCSPVNDRASCLN